MLASLAWAPRPAFAAPPSDASTQRFVGEITDQTSHWDSSGRSIITESTLTTPTGEKILLQQLGGSVDGIGMRVSHGPAIPIQGATIDVTVRVDSAASHTVVEVREPTSADRAYFVPSIAPITRVPLRWESSCAFFRFDAKGTSHLPGDDEFAAMRTAVDSWNNGASSCSYFRLVEEPSEPGEAGEDGVNRVILRSDSWCRQPCTEPVHNYPRLAAGVTLYFFIDDVESDRNGAILDADIELNGVNFSLSADGESLGPSACKSDIANTLTHELGHLLGLDHTCQLGEDNGSLDNTGSPVPICSPRLPSSITEATMFVSQECGETKKITLEADDLDGVCGIYPAANDPGECQAPVLARGGCCSLAANDPMGPLNLFWSSGFALLLAFSGRRSRKG